MAPEPRATRLCRSGAHRRARPHPGIGGSGPSISTRQSSIPTPAAAESRCSTTPMLVPSAPFRTVPSLVSTTFDQSAGMSADPGTSLRRKTMPSPGGAGCHAMHPERPHGGSRLQREPRPRASGVWPSRPHFGLAAQKGRDFEAVVLGDVREEIVGPCRLLQERPSEITCASSRCAEGFGWSCCQEPAVGGALLRHRGEAAT